MPRPRTRRTVILASMAAIVLSACGSDAPPGPTPRVVAVRTVDLGPNWACGGVGLAAEIHGNPDDPDVVWLVNLFPGRERLGVVFPTGTRAVFDPDLSIVDATGRVLMREGDFVDGACVTRFPDRMLLLPPFPSFRLDCGPMPVGECASSRASQAAGKADGAHHPIAVIRFLDVSGDFEAVYEDGTRMRGSTSSN